MIIKPIGVTPEQFVKRAFYLAYDACGGARGLGILQSSRLGGNSPSEDEVWRCVFNAEDYDGYTRNRPGDVYGDYVFGRMMKWGAKFDAETVTAHEREFTIDYQSFCREYPDNQALFEATAKSLGVTFEVIEPEKKETTPQ